MLVCGLACIGVNIIGRDSVVIYIVHWLVEIKTKNTFIGFRNKHKPYHHHEHRDICRFRSFGTEDKR